MKQPKQYLLKCPRQPITMAQTDAIAKYLREQPRYDHKLKQEDGRYTDNKHMHYLWRKENQATDWKDFTTEWANGHYIKTDRAHLVMPGELFLCDSRGGELWIVYENAAGKLFEIAPVSTDMNRDYGNCFNGYALIPKDVYEKAAPIGGLYVRA